MACSPSILPQVPGVRLVVAACELTLIGEGNWHEAVIGYYPTRKAMLQIASLPEYASLVVHRTAGLKAALTVALHEPSDVRSLLECRGPGLSCRSGAMLAPGGLPARDAKTAPRSVAIAGEPRAAFFFAEADILEAVLELVLLPLVLDEPIAYLGLAFRVSRYTEEVIDPACDLEAVVDDFPEGNIEHLCVWIGFAPGKMSLHLGGEFLQRPSGELPDALRVAVNSWVEAPYRLSEAMIGSGSRCVTTYLAPGNVLLM